MRLTAERPFLREVERPVATLPPERRDMLNDTGLLIVCLFDQERIVLDAFRKRLVARGRGRMHINAARRGQREHRRGEDKCNPDIHARHPN